MRIAVAWCLVLGICFQGSVAIAQPVVTTDDKGLSIDFTKKPNAEKPQQSTEPDDLYRAVQNAKQQYDNGDYSGSLAALQAQLPSLESEGKLWAWEVLSDMRMCLVKLHKDAEAKQISARIDEIGKSIKLIPPDHFELIAENKGLRAAVFTMVSLTALHSNGGGKLVSRGNGNYAVTSAPPPQWKQDMITAFTMKAQGQYAQALPYAEKSAREAESAKTDTKNLATVYNLLGGVYRYNKRYDQAIAAYEKSMSLMESLNGKASADYATALDNIAQVYSQTGDMDRTALYQKQALTIYQKVLPHNSPDLAITLCNYGNTLSNLGQLEAAEKCYKDAIAIYQACLPADDRRLATAYDNFGALYVRMHKLSEAEQMRRDALEIYRNALGPVHPDTTICMSNLIATLVNERKDAEARQLIEQHTAELKESNSPSLPEFAHASGQAMNIILGRQGQ